MKWAIMPVVAGVTVAGPTLAQIPDEISQKLPQGALRGSAEVGFFGFEFYRVELWTELGAPFDPAAPFALTLTYERQFKARTLAKTTVEEIARIEDVPESDFLELLPKLELCFADVQEGDRITGFNVDADEARFFVNGTPSCDIRYPAFTERFFGIWLGEKTRDPKARKALLGDMP